MVMSSTPVSWRSCGHWVSEAVVSDTETVGRAAAGQGGDRCGLDFRLVADDRTLGTLPAERTPDTLILAANVCPKVRDKDDRYLGEELLNQSHAARALDVPYAWAALTALTCPADDEAPAPLQGRTCG